MVPDQSMRFILSMNAKLASASKGLPMNKRKKAQISDRLKRDIAAKYGCRRGKVVSAKCCYCDYVGQIRWIAHSSEAAGFVSFKGLHVEHVIPESRGGDTAIENLVLACRPCNLDKGNRTPDEWRRAR